MNNYDKLVENLKVIAKERFGTPSQMAESIGFSQPIMSNILTKSSRPRIDTICGLLDKLGGEIIFPDISTTVIRDSSPEISPDINAESPNIKSLESKIAMLQGELAEERRLAKELVQENSKLTQDNRELTQDNRELMKEVRELYKKEA